MRIVLLGDIHLYKLRVALRHLFGKRMLGQCNLWFHRRHVFDPKLLGPVLARAMSLEPDWLLFSGDLTTTAQDGEFALAARELGLVEGSPNHGLLEPLLSGGRVVAVPGNHDRYTYAATRGKRMEVFLKPIVPPAWPWQVKLDDRWQLVALDSCCPRPWSSRGDLDADQLERLEQMMRDSPRETGTLVLCHYPFEVPPGQIHRPSHQLANRHELEAILKQARGPVVFVHGHIHRPWHWKLTLDEHPDFRVINTGSPCMTSSEFPAGQGFWEMVFSPSQGAAGTHDIALRAHRPTTAANPSPAADVGVESPARPMHAAQPRALTWRIEDHPWLDEQSVSPAM